VGRGSNADEGMDEDLDLEDDDGIFNEAEYDFYMQPENINFCARKPIGYSVINHYMCAILDLHQQQIIMVATTLQKSSCGQIESESFWQM